MVSDMSESNLDEVAYSKPERTRRSSIMRDATHNRDLETEMLTESELTRRKRGFFHSLPTGCGNDMVLGSW